MVEDGEYCVSLQEVIITDPALENFSTIRTGINIGYLYIIDENKPDQPIEFEVDSYGNFKSISWEKGGEGFPDVRETDGKNNTSGYYEAEFGSIIWAAYSPVQWSKAYYDLLVGDTARRKERMTQIQANGFPLGTVKSTTDHAPYTGITTYFTADKSSLCRGVQQKIDAIQKQEEKRDKNRKENPDHTEPEVLTDMFITLEDPISSAIEINEVLSEKILYFKALVDAIQTGENIEDAYNRINQGCLEAPKPEKEYQSLISLALTCYLMIYNDDAAILKHDGGTPGRHYERHALDPRPKKKQIYDSVSNMSKSVVNNKWIGYGLDYQKLNGILGIEEREEQRSQIQNLKKDMATYIQVKDLKKILEDYLHNIPERTLDGRGLFLDILEGLMTNTYDFDRHMLLKKQYQPTDEWIDWGYELLNKKFEDKFTGTEVTSTATGYENYDPLYALLTPLVNIDKVVDKSRSISHKIAKVYKKKLKHHGKQAFVVKKVGRTMFKEITEKQEFVVQKLNENLTLYGEEMFEIQDGEMRMKLHKMGVEIDTDYIPQSSHTRLKGKFNYAGTKKGNLLKRKPGFKNTKRELEILRALVGEENVEAIKIVESVERGGKQNKIAVRVRQMVTNAEIEANKPNVKIAQMVNGRAFNGVFAGLELINFGVAGYKVGSNIFSKDEFNKKYAFNFVGASFKITEAGANLYKAQLSFKNPKNPKIIGVGKFATQLSIIGGTFTAGMCFWESYEAMDKGDMDSGIALAMAGVSFGVSTATSLSIFAASSWAGPVGWIAAGVGVGLIIIASLLTDNEVETFFKNFLLSDTEAFPKDKGDTPMDYSRKILANKGDLVDDDFIETLMNPADAEAALMDAIVCKNMVFTPTTTKIEGRGYDPYFNSSGIKTHTVSAYKIEMSFLQFFNHEDQVDTEIVLYPNGIKNGDPYPLDIDGGSLCKTTNNDGKDILVLEFSIPEEKQTTITKKSEVLIAIRLKMDPTANLYFPYPIGGKERYLGAKIKLKGDRVMLSDMIQDKKIKYGALYELKDYETWK